MSLEESLAKLTFDQTEKRNLEDFYFHIGYMKAILPKVEKSLMMRSANKVKTEVDLSMLMHYLKELSQ